MSPPIVPTRTRSTVILRRVSVSTEMEHAIPGLEMVSVHPAQPVRSIR